MLATESQYSAEELKAMQTDIIDQGFQRAARQVLVANIVQSLNYTYNE